MRLEIVPLTGLPRLVPLLAAWHHAEWEHLYHDAVWDIEAAGRELEAMANGASDDVTLVAFDGPGRSPDDVLGSVSLVATDDLAGFEHLSPWLASLFVRESARGHGAGAALVDALFTAAADRGDEYVHLFTSGQEEYWSTHGWRVLASVEASGHPATVMARGTHPRSARRAVCSRWCGDPDVNGAYSYLRVGGTPAHRALLGTEVLPRLWLAGEATSVEYPATMHGAWFSGERAADQVIAAVGTGSVVVVGAGLAGMVAARRLGDAGLDTIVLESMPRPGGRITTDTTLGVPVPLGAAWLHGEIGHPLAPMVTWTEERWSHRAVFVAGHGRLDPTEVEQMAAAYSQVHAAYRSAPPTANVADVVAETVDRLDLSSRVRAGVISWLTAECESLYAAPMGDIAANGGFEPYELPGDDRLITSSLQVVIDELAAGLDLRCGHRVGSLVLEDDRWRTDTGIEADAVIVTIPIGALRTGRIAVTPELPTRVLDAIDHLAAGPVTKLFATFDTVWWPPERPLRIAGRDELTSLVDVTELTGIPTLCGFAVGDAARRIEAMSEHELCLLVDDVANGTGLRDWDA